MSMPSTAASYVPNLATPCKHAYALMRIRFRHHAGAYLRVRADAAANECRLCNLRQCIVNAAAVYVLNATAAHVLQDA